MQSAGASARELSTARRAVDRRLDLRSDLRAVRHPVIDPTVARDSASDPGSSAARRVVGRSLAGHFWAAARPGPWADCTTPGTLERLLSQMVARGRAAWPGVPLAEERFVRFVARRVRSTGDASVALRRMNAEGLFFACACAAGEPAAASRFFVRFGPEIERAVLAVGCVQATADDAKQAIYEKLFVGDHRGVLRIRHYKGQGDLACWLRVVAMHYGIDAARRQQREEPVDEDWLAASLADERTPELLLVEHRCRRELQRALRGSLGSLAHRERELLHHRFVAGRSIDEIGVLYGVHRGTVWRWFQRVRKKMLRLIDRRTTNHSRRRAPDDSWSSTSEAIGIDIARLLGPTGPETAG